MLVCLQKCVSVCVYLRKIWFLILIDESNRYRWNPSRTQPLCSLYAYTTHTHTHPPIYFIWMPFFRRVSACVYRNPARQFLMVQPIMWFQSNRSYCASSYNNDVHEFYYVQCDFCGFAQKNEIEEFPFEMGIMTEKNENDDWLRANQHNSYQPCICVFFFSYQRFSSPHSYFLHTLHKMIMRSTCLCYYVKFTIMANFAVENWLCAGAKETHQIDLTKRKTENRRVKKK